jgi:hypothetical protein
MDISLRMTRVLLTGGVSALAALLLASCAAEPVPPCPSVRIDNATANVTQFRDGPGRDVGDIVYQAEIVTYNGSCTQDLEQDEGSAEVEMEVEFALATGPAAPAGELPVYYFVAVPQLFPEAHGKQVFQINRKSAGGAAKAERWTETIRITLPVTRARPSAAFDIYVGFQLTGDQLAFNRTRIR